ncbi:MAG TPA: glycosyltransferase family A protein, partial [Tepidisphaeraceae bacterium]|nr:glycosyltransferase family A protein [Tepidisphaeraceae bacterium]
MKFSLIVPTVDRVAELERLLTSLQRQTLRDFEVLVVDQNADDRVTTVIERCGKRLSIVHLRCQRGTSRARNLGIRRAAGTVMAFPDDDCWYPPDVLEEIWKQLCEHPQWD